MAAIQSFIFYTVEPKKHCVKQVDAGHTVGGQSPLSYFLIPTSYFLFYGRLPQMTPTVKLRLHLHLNYTPEAS